MISSTLSMLGSQLSGLLMGGLPATLSATLAISTQLSFALRVLGVLFPAFFGIYLMLPKGGKSGGPSRIFGAVLVVLSLVLATTFPLSSAEGAVDGSAASVLWSIPDTLTCTTFHGFAFVSVASAVMMITARNPVYSALWFSLVLLSNSGLYMLQQAEFLSAATIIVYAGAIVVTFLFVIMLAQPSGAARYDRFSRESLLSAVTGLLLATALLGTIHTSMRSEGRTPESNVASRPTESSVAMEAGATPTVLKDADRHVAGLGKTLFRDHIVSVEITGLLLLAAVVGAMLIAGHRTEESHVRK